MSYATLKKGVDAFSNQLIKLSMIPVAAALYFQAHRSLKQEILI